MNLYDLEQRIEDPIRNQTEQRLLQSVQVPVEAPIVGFHVDGESVFLTDTTALIRQIDLDREEEQFGLPRTVYEGKQSKLHFARFSRIDRHLNLLVSKDTNPQIVDVTQGKQVWKARNVRNDWLDLQVPIWDIDGQFQATNTLFTATAYQKIRSYDTRKNNAQPTLDFQFSFENDKTPFTKLLISSCGNYLYVSNNGGSIYILDTRKGKREVGDSEMMMMRERRKGKVGESEI